MFNEYEAMTCVLSDNYKDDIKDLLLTTYGEHPITYGDSFMDNNEMKPFETVLTLKDDHCSNQSLDYIFQFTPRSLFSNNDDKKPLLNKQRLAVIDKTARVEKFLTADHAFTQLSDHYGVMVALEYCDVTEDYPETKEKKKKSIFIKYILMMKKSSC